MSYHLAVDGHECQRRAEEEPVPTYQYACTACDERSEVVQKFTDDPLTECAVCGGRLRKVFSPVGIVFKGSGFYRNDSRNGAVSASKDKEKDGKPAGSGDKSETKAPAASGSDSGKSSGDSKPEKKSDSKSPSSSKTPSKVA
jgi:putative FmdB family regulatory protein